MRGHFSSNTDRTPAASTRGVSDVIAFVLVFSIIIASVGVVFVVGFGALGDLRQGEQFANAERAMSAMDVAFDGMLQNRAPVQRSGLNLQGETLVVDDDSRLQIEVQRNGTVNDSVRPSGALVYSPGGDTEVAYEGGAVFRRDSEDVVMTRDPSIGCSGSSPERALVTVPTVRRADGQGGISADGTVTIEARTVRGKPPSTFPTNQTQRDAQGANVQAVRINVSGSRYEEGWRSFFEEDDDWNHLGGSVYECEFSSGSGTVFVRNPPVELQFTV